MPIETKGTARIRHKDTGGIFEIEADELEWQAVGGSERQMGSEIEYAAEMDHPELGELAWRLWEYPVGAENYQDEDLGGHELIENFEISLVHEPDEEEEEEEEGASIGMKEWFYGAYEDPAQSLPYNSREGGYQWIRGGPYTALEALEEQFGQEYPFSVLERVAEEIEDESGGTTEWSPTDDPELPDREYDAFDAPSEEERRLAAERVAQSARELETLLAPLLEIEQEASGSGDRRPGIGHNGPPSAIEEIGLPPGFFEALSLNARQVADAIERTETLLDAPQAADDVLNRSPVAEERDSELANALASHADALRQNTSAVIENSELLREKSIVITPKSFAIGGLVGVAGAKVVDGVLGKLGELLVEKGLPLVTPLGPAAAGYLETVSSKIQELAELALQYISMLPPIF